MLKRYQRATKNPVGHEGSTRVVDVPSRSDAYLALRLTDAASCGQLDFSISGPDPSTTRPKSRSGQIWLSDLAGRQGLSPDCCRYRAGFRARAAATSMSLSSVKFGKGDLPGFVAGPKKGPAVIVLQGECGTPATLGSRVCNVLLFRSSSTGSLTQSGGGSLTR